ncbi:MAG TPA: DUF938 domain-containing protein [Xanthomonadaceae bacterium]|nr:DUF938 domain-containing protein [Xanthomonadaceae bacterium]
MEKPFSAASERNREPILGVLLRHFADRTHVLEIGSGTGQHAAHFAGRLPHLVWQTSDLEENHAGIAAWVAGSGAPNLRMPITLDVADAHWPGADFDAVFTANTLHILSWEEVRAMFAGIARLQVRTRDLKLAAYGPFRYQGRHTSDSNARFDASLRQAAPWRGIRDFQAVDALAAAAGLERVEDAPMPANNRCLVWRSRP